jgi:hypothetical protein
MLAGNASTQREPYNGCPRLAERSLAMLEGRE